MGRAVSEDCQPASATLLHSVNPFPSITRSARLTPLPRAARCKSPPGCLLIAHEVWRLSSFSSGKFCELRDFAYGQNLCVLYAKFPPPKAKRLQLVMPHWGSIIAFATAVRSGPSALHGFPFSLDFTYFTHCKETLQFFLFKKCVTCIK